MDISNQKLFTENNEKLIDIAIQLEEDIYVEIDK